MPEHILVTIFQYIPQNLRPSVSLVCEAWREAFSSPYLWNNVKFSLKTSQDNQFVKFVENYGNFIQSIEIEVNQFELCNRTHAETIIYHLSRIPRRRLTKFALIFTGENPCLYNAKEFKDALGALFGPPPTVEDYHVPSLKVVDLSRVNFSLENETIDSLSYYNPGLERANLQFKTIVSQVASSTVLKLVQRCKQLKELCVYSDNFDIDVMMCLMENDRQPLEHLYLLYRRETKYIRDIPSGTWQEFVTKLPDLYVTLAFDHTCPLLCIPDVMKAEIPVKVLKLETYTYIYNEVRQATEQYKDTLTEFTLRAPLSKNSPDLNDALVDMAEKCKLIKSMYVYCDIEKETSIKILNALPVLRSNNAYSLKYE